MRTIFLIAAVSICLSFYSDGGEPERSKIIDDYEPNLNLQYFGIRDTITFTDKKNKVKKIPVTSNAAIYSVKGDSIYYLFNDGLKRNIIEFIFESEYIEAYKTISFNNEYSPANYDRYAQGLYSFSNNRNVEKRPLSDNLILFTKDPLTELTTIWISTKYGKNIKKVFEFTDGWGWEIDVKNRMVRLSRQVGLKIEMKNEKY